MNKIALLSTVLGLVGALGACGDGDDPATASSGGSSSSGASSSGSSSGGSSSGADSGAVDAGPKVVVQSEPLNVTVQILPSSATLNGKIFTPATCQKAAPCPLVVVVADRDMTGYPTLEEPAEKLAARAEMVVVVFNLPGKGTGGFQSGGEDDIGGNNHVTAVKEVMKLISTRPQVDATRVGFLTIGYGLVPVAHALRLHGSNTLKKVLFLVDVEGPTDRCAIRRQPRVDRVLTRRLADHQDRQGLQKRLVAGTRALQRAEVRRRALPTHPVQTRPPLAESLREPPRDEGDRVEQLAVVHAQRPAAVLSDPG